MPSRRYFAGLTYLAPTSPLARQSHPPVNARLWPVDASGGRRLTAEGVKPGNLPGEQPTKFELIINLKKSSGAFQHIPDHSSTLQRTSFHCRLLT